MSDCRKYVDYIMEQAKNLLAIDSPSGYGREVTEYLLKELCTGGGKASREPQRAGDPQGKRDVCEGVPRRCG